jgi:glycosyltransferase involved in cell wall biosynthesis
MPAVSVIVPNYNHGNHLTQRLDSILNQTFQDLELIILDDRSTDNSRQVIERYRSDPRVKHIIYNETNSGSPFKQWENGVAASVGEWLWIAESDDYCSEIFLETLLDEADPAKRIGLIYCDSHRVIGDKVQPDTFAKTKNDTFCTSRWSQSHFNEGKKEIESFLMNWGTINNTSAVLFHRKTFLDANPFDRAFRLIGDKYSFIKVLAISNVAYVPQALNYYRAAPDGTPKHSAEFMDYAFEQFHVFDWISRNLPNLDRGAFRKAFLRNTESSLIAGWNSKKWHMFTDMRKLNTDLFHLYLKHNLVRSFNRVFEVRSA